MSIIYWEFLQRDQFFSHVLTSLWPKICWIRKFIWIFVHRLTQAFQNSVVYVHVLLFDPIVAYYLLDMGLTWPQSGFSLLVITVQILGLQNKTYKFQDWVISWLPSYHQVKGYCLVRWDSYNIIIFFYMFEEVSWKNLQIKVK